MKVLIERIEEFNWKRGLATGALAGTLAFANPVSAKEVGVKDYKTLKAYGDLDKVAGYVYQEIVGQPASIQDEMIKIIASLIKANDSSDPLKVAKEKLVAYKKPPAEFIEKFKKAYVDAEPVRYVYHSYQSKNNSIDMSKYVPSGWVSSTWAKGVKPYEIEVYWGRGKERFGKKSFYKLSDIIKERGKSPYLYQKRIGSPAGGVYYVYKENW